MSEPGDPNSGIIRPASPLAFVPPGPTANRSAPGSKPPPLPAAANLPRAEREKVGGQQTGVDAAGNSTVGWLVIMAGPGRGRSLTLGSGMNHLGRAATNRVAIDFGDSEISLQAQTTVTYDPRGRKFYVQPAPDAASLTYLGEEGTQPVLMPTEITGGEIISLGKTRLKFVPFCGTAFSWE